MASSKKWRKKGKRNTKFKKKREGRPLMPNKDTKKQMMKWKFNSTTTNAQKFIIFASFQFFKFFDKKLALLVPVYWKHNILNFLMVCSLLTYYDFTWFTAKIYQLRLYFSQAGLWETDYAWGLNLLYLGSGSPLLLKFSNWNAQFFFKWLPFRLTVRNDE